MFKPLLAIGLALALPACVRWQPVPLTGDAHVSGAPRQIRAAAAEAYRYAQMAANAYDDAERYDLGPDIVTRYATRVNRGGDAHAIFDRMEGGRVVEVIIAFRGSESWTRDDWAGDGVAARQAENGRIIHMQMRSWIGPEIPITVTGHGAGGRIAMAVSREGIGVRAYVFNAPLGPQPPTLARDQRRLSIVEREESLGAPRMAARGPGQVSVAIGCPHGLATVRQHFSRRIADCLTRLAAFESAAARASLLRNRIRRPVGLPAD